MSLFRKNSIQIFIFLILVLINPVVLFAQNEVLQKKIADKAEQKANLEVVVDSLDEIIASLNLKINQDDLQSNQDELDKVKNQLSKIEGEIIKAKENTSQAQKTKAENQNIITKNQKQVKDLGVTLNELNDKTDKINDKINKINLFIGELNRKKDSIDAAINSKKNRILELQKLNGNFGTYAEVNYKYYLLLRCFMPELSNKFELLLKDKAFNKNKIESFLNTCGGYRKYFENDNRKISYYKACEFVDYSNLFVNKTSISNEEFNEIDSRFTQISYSQFSFYLDEQKNFLVDIREKLKKLRK